MSVVGGYPQAYHHHHPGASGFPSVPHPQDFYPYSSTAHPQSGSGTRYGTEHSPAASAESPASAAYFHSWMINPHPSSAHPNSSPHPAELPPGMAPSEPPPNEGGPFIGPGVYSSMPPGADYNSMTMLTMIDPVTGLRVRGFKRRNTANKKERRRTHSINSAFSSLRGCIPNVPTDTKLSKIKTLRLATSYIAYLMDVLNKDDPLLTENGFKAELTKKIESREDKRRRETEEIQKATKGNTTSESSPADKKSKGRTGWPQQVWAAELKQ